MREGERNVLGFFIYFFFLNVCGRFDLLKELCMPNYFSWFCFDCVCRVKYGTEIVEEREQWTLFWNNCI